MKLTCASPSIVWARGSQKRPSCNPYSTVTALTFAFIGVIIGFNQVGMSSSGSCSSWLSCFATAMMSISCAMR